MKAILISIKPKWVAKILNGEKTIEIRKTMPKCDLPIDVYIYCTKEKLYLANATELFTGKYACISNDEVSYKEHNLNGKVVAKFTLNKVEEIKIDIWNKMYLPESLINQNQLLMGAQLTLDELRQYLNNRVGYAIHISELKIFDKPKELSEFRPSYQGKCLTSKCKYCDECGYCDVECRDERLTKAPQSFMFIEVE